MPKKRKVVKKPRVSLFRNMATVRWVAKALTQLFPHRETAKKPEPVFLKFKISFQGSPCIVIWLFGDYLRGCKETQFLHLWYFLARICTIDNP